MKTCTRCNETKDETEFNKRKQLKTGLRSQCRLCDRVSRNKERRKIYLQSLSDDQREVYRQKRRERYIEKKQAGLIKKPNKDRENRWRREQYANNPQYRMIVQIRNRLKKTLDRKLGNIEPIIGCSPAYLQLHLESQFQPGMTWDNHGQFGWHIDHIIPLSSFDLTDEEQLKKACHYTNLQPLWWQDNLKKRDKIEV